MVKRHNRTTLKNKKVNGTKRVKKTGKKKTGGMHKPSLPSLSRALPTTDQAMRLRTLGRPGSESGMAKFMLGRFGSAVDAVNSRQTKGLASDLRESAQRLHAHSFVLANPNLQTCATKNKQAVNQLEQAVALGNLPACADLANMLLNGSTVGVPEDFDKAVELVSQVDDQDKDCKGVMAQCYFHTGEYNRARRLAEKSAAAGSKYGQLVLGLLEKRNPSGAAAAVEWFQLAAAQNYDKAQLTLGQLYATGAVDGVRDYAQASRFFLLAAEQGNRHAFVELGRLEHVARNIDECKRWCALARDAGSDDPFVHHSQS